MRGCIPRAYPGLAHKTRHSQQRCPSFPPLRAGLQPEPAVGVQSGKLLLPLFGQGQICDEGGLLAGL